MDPPNAIAPPSVEIRTDAYESAVKARETHEESMRNTARNSRGKHEKNISNTRGKREKSTRSFSHEKSSSNSFARGKHEHEESTRARKACEVLSRKNRFLLRKHGVGTSFNVKFTDKSVGRLRIPFELIRGSKTGSVVRLWQTDLILT